MKSKICKKCSKEYPVTNEYFRKSKDHKDGFRNTCKKCEAEYNKRYKKIYHEQNKETIKERRKQYYEANKEKIIKRVKQYTKIHKEIISEKQKQYYQAHKSKKMKCIKRYYENHKEEIAKYKKQYYETHKAETREDIKKWRQNNIEKIRIYTERYKSKKNQLPATLTTEQWKQIKQHFNNKCAYCGKELPLAQEHFIPLSKGGEYTKNNIVCACKSCNSSKGKKDFKTWYKTYRYYSKEREKAILEFLGYKDNKQQLSII